VNATKKKKVLACSWCGEMSNNHPHSSGPGLLKRGHRERRSTGPVGKALNARRETPGKIGERGGKRKKNRGNRQSALRKVKSWQNADQNKKGDGKKKKEKWTAQRGCPDGKHQMVGKASPAEREGRKRMRAGKQKFVHPNGNTNWQVNKV